MMSMFSKSSDVKVAVRPPHLQRNYRSTRQKKKEDHAAIDKVLPPKRAVSTQSSSQLSDESASSMYSYLIDPKVVYKFRIIQFNTLTASANVIATYFNLDPTSMDEWSSFSPLFSVFRVIGARLTVNPCNTGSTSTTNGRPWLVVCPEVGLSSTAPASGQKCFDGPLARLISPLPGMPHKDYQFTFPQGVLPMMWQAIGGSGQEPWAGGWGQFSVYGQTAGASDTYQTAIEIFVELSGRT